MPASLSDVRVLDALDAAHKPVPITVKISGHPRPIHVPHPYPSPVDWRDVWIYFLMVDRFNNPDQPPRTAWDQPTGDRQGGTFNGIRGQLEYLKDLGAGALWISPVLKNCQTPVNGSHHGYGIMDFISVDPRFASRNGNAEEEFAELVKEAHAMGMWVILDIVINHAGDIFAYDINGVDWNSVDWSSQPYEIHWRDQDGKPRSAWNVLPPSSQLPANAGVWPMEFQSNELFRRQGKGTDLLGDFESLKEFNTEYQIAGGTKPVLDNLIKSYQYIIARFDVDGFRIDTIKHVERDFAMTFCNAIREFALSIGKENFFIFGENRSDDENLLASYTGRFCTDPDLQMGADAAIDFPLMWRLDQALKGFSPPTSIEDVFNLRKQVEKDRMLVATHGDASRFFVTGLDSHDDSCRFLYPVDGGDYTRQVTMAVAALFCLQGIPYLYYGTEQGLRGTRELYQPGYNSGMSKPENVREALWGKPDAFDRNHEIFRETARISELRHREPALRFGRQYFRPVSGNGVDFGASNISGGVLAFSRILHSREVVVIANTNTTLDFNGQVLVDGRLSRSGVKMDLLYSNQGSQSSETVKSGQVTYYDRQNHASQGAGAWLSVHLKPMEIQVLAARQRRRRIQPITGETSPRIDHQIN